eukprot:19327-Heterococcus_DN1.PRE.3
MKAESVPTRSSSRAAADAMQRSRSSSEPAALDYVISTTSSTQCRSASKLGDITPAHATALISKQTACAERLQSTPALPNHRKHSTAWLIILEAHQHYYYINITSTVVAV